MDVEDEPNSYLKYLNDSETPNAYLLENNEVGLFPVEPIFTEMEATDWQQEGFPLLLTNSLITEEDCSNSDTISNHLTAKSPCVTEVLSNSVGLHENIESSLGSQKEDVQGITELPENVLQPIKNEIIFDENEIHISKEIPFNQNELQLNENEERMVTDDCVQFNENSLGNQGGLRHNQVPQSETEVQLQPNQKYIVIKPRSKAKNEIIFDENEIHISKEIPFNQNELQLNESEERMMIDDCVQFNENSLGNQGGLRRNQVPQSESAVQLQPNQKYIVIKPSSKAHKQTRQIQLVNSDGTPIPIDDSVLASIHLPIAQKKLVATRNKTKTVNDLFSTVIANKCKICSFLCEDLEQIKKHISTKHPEFIFTHNGLSNGVSILLSNASNKVQQNTKINKEFTVYVCSECHGVCTDKDDLKNHMIQTHGLATEPESSVSKSNEEAVIDTKPVKKMSAYLDDVNVGLVKKQERIVQQVKCTVKGCMAGFPSEELRKKHEKLHVGDTKSMFACTECDKTFMMWSVARSHMQKEHSIDFGMIVCPLCNIFKSYKSVRMLRHMMIHSDVMPFLCSDCGKSFRQLAQLRNHEALHKLPEDMPTWSKVKKCNKCERFFANSKTLKTHIKTVHEKIKPFICNICGHKCSRKDVLQLHTRQHTALKPHKCDHCEYKTGDPNCLRRHVMKHLGRVTYQCPYCPYSCIQAGSIKSHFIRRHKEKAGVFFCKYCSYTTINETFLIAHEKTHESSSKATNNVDASVAQRGMNENDLQTDEETQSCFLTSETQIEETVDNGGITIPAGLELPLVS